LLLYICMIYLRFLLYIHMHKRFIIIEKLRYIGKMTMRIQDLSRTNMSRFQKIWMFVRLFAQIEMFIGPIEEERVCSVGTRNNVPWKSFQNPPTRLNRWDPNWQHYGILNSYDFGRIFFFKMTDPHCQCRGSRPPAFSSTVVWKKMIYIFSHPGNFGKNDIRELVYNA